MSDRTLTNPFVTNPPNFNELFAKYPDLESSKERDNLKVDTQRFFRVLKFDYPLSRAVLKEYFDLELSLPMDFLIPNIASVLDHMLWIEEILHATYGAEKFIRVLDLGTDPSFVYPLIGAKYFKWNVVCTKTTQTDFDYAVKNVEDNDLSSAIQILKVNEGSLISGALSKLEDSDFDFVICNVPGFKLKKGKKSGLNQANMKYQEDLIASAFIKQMVPDSFETRNHVKICFLNAKRKAHGALVRHEIHQINCPQLKRHSNTYHCQHVTCIGWAFDSSVVFPMVEHRKEAAQNRKREAKRVPSWDVPENIRCLDVYDRTQLCEKLTRLFEGLLIPCEEEEVDDDSGNKSLIITAYTNTWGQRKNARDDEEDEETFVDDDSGQPSMEAQKKRNKRWRQKATKQKQNGKDETGLNGDHPVETAQDCAASGDPPHQNDAAAATTSRKRTASDCEPSAEPWEQQPEDAGPSAKAAMLEYPPAPEETGPDPSLVPLEESPVDCDALDDAGAPRHLVKARLLVRINKDKLCVEMHWISGSNRADMHHILQFVRDFLKYT